MRRPLPALLFQLFLSRVPSFPSLTLENQRKHSRTSASVSAVSFSTGPSWSRVCGPLVLAFGSVLPEGNFVQSPFPLEPSARSLLLPGEQALYTSISLGQMTSDLLDFRAGPRSISNTLKCRQLSFCIEEVLPIA